jgi:hypothetical protein
VEPLPLSTLSTNVDGSIPGGNDMMTAFSNIVLTSEDARKQHGTNDAQR